MPPTNEDVLELVRQGRVFERKCSTAQFVDDAGRVVVRQVCALINLGLVKVEGGRVVVASR